MAGNAAVPGRSVTSKVGAILDAFLPSSRELSLNELSERTGLPPSTVYRLVCELVDWGGLERVSSGGYRVGLKLWEIASLAAGGVTLQEVAAPFMQDLYEATHENVQLAVLQGREALYIEKITGRRSSPVRTRRGGRLPLHATGVGKVLLAHAPPDLVEAVLAAGLRRYTAHTLVAPAQLRRALADVRRTGMACARSELTLDSVSVAAPVSDASGRVVAAMSVVLRPPARDLRQLGLAVRTAALGVSRELRQRGVRVDRTPL